MIWLIVGVLLIGAEVVTLTAALGLLGVAALITSLAAAVGLPPPLQLLVFTIVSVIAIVLVRPVARRHMQRPQLERFGVDALIGKKAHVVQEVTGDAGRVRIDGEEWTARAFDESLVIPAGATVDVMAIRGAIAVVYPRE
ncbi:MAG TPA: NfeD family protein [Pseudonocardiaceae bacterium]|nr:NfeD family protein [Pseudonocardiaceae bacterium]